MKLYIDHYSKVHKGKTMTFVVREGILRDNLSFIVEDLKFLIRHGIKIVLYHNIAPNLGNNTFLRENIESKISSAILKRVPPNVDIYEYVLSIKEIVDKLIFIERQYLIGEEGEKINIISTKKLALEIKEEGLLIGNTNFRGALFKICKAVETGDIDRVHILPGGRKYAIRHELFSLEGVGTLIGNDFGKPDIKEITTDDVSILKGILDSKEGNKYIKKRSIEYIEKNISNFRIAYIDGIPVGCVEMIQENEYTIELGALKVVCSFLSLKLGKALIEYVISYAISEGFEIISLTNNKKLQGIYERFGFIENKKGLFQDRAKKSPGVKIFHMDTKDL